MGYILTAIQEAHIQRLPEFHGLFEHQDMAAG
jgi:hypothetical protein